MLGLLSFVLRKEQSVFHSGANSVHNIPLSIRTSIRRLTKYAILTISVVSAAIVEGLITNWIGSFFEEPTYLTALIGMVVLVAVYVPLFGYLGQYIDRGSKRYVETSKGLVGNRKIGLLAGFALAIVVLFVLFAMVEYDLYLHEDVARWLGL